MLGPRMGSSSGGSSGWQRRQHLAAPADAAKVLGHHRVGPELGVDAQQQLVAGLWGGVGG